MGKSGVSSNDQHSETSLKSTQFQDDHVAGTYSGILRAGIFGVSDGLVSNLALVMGVAGGTSDAGTIVLAGAAGLLAGGFSMAAGEYISMRIQREALERELRLEREHIINYPDEEEASLVEMLEANGLDRTDAERIAEQVHKNVEPAIDFHARFELGIHPTNMGSPSGAAASSFVAFVIGALVPVLPWLFNPKAMVLSIVLSAVALILVGAGATKLTGLHPVKGALRQLFFGAAAATVTFAIGSIIGNILGG
jgi:VIT1/CCC1 family predicted Fe2+/Mn2+ transporter